MAQTLGADIHSRYAPFDFAGPTRERLIALDFVRQGAVSTALQRLHCLAPADTPRHFDRSIPHHTFGEDAFIGALADLARDLRAEGW